MHRPGWPRRTLRLLSLLFLLGSLVPCRVIAAPDVSRLLPALSSTDEAVRADAVQQANDLARSNLTLAERRNLAAQLGPRLVELAQQGPERTRLAALDAVSRLAVSAELAQPMYLRELRRPEAHERQAVAAAVLQHLRLLLTDPQTGRLDAQRLPAEVALAEARGLAHVCGAMLADDLAAIRAPSRAGLEELWNQLATRLPNVAEEQRLAPALRQELAATAQAWSDFAPLLARQLRDAPPAERLATAQTFESLVRLLRGWQKASSACGFSHEEGQRLGAAIAQATDQIPALTADLLTLPSDQQLAILNVLEAFGQDAEPARPLLLELVTRSRSPFVRWSSLRTLSQLPPPADGSGWPRLNTCLADEDSDVRCMALHLLANWTAERHQAALVLVSPHGNGILQRRDTVLAVARLLEQGSAREQDLALQVLSTMAEEAVPALPRLRAVMMKGQPELRLRVVELLARLGKPAEPTLTAALRDGDEAVRLAAARALQRLGK